MPILEVEIVGAAGAEDGIEGLAARLAEAAGLALGARPGGTWVRLRFLAPEHYAESGGAGDVRPVFVRVLERAVPDHDRLATRIEALTVALAEACGRPPGNVHVLYEPPAAGRMAFGGKLVG